MMHSIFILGGARSGKSRFAQQLATALGGDDVLFVATAEASDDEMAERIRRHQVDRPAAWQLLEVPRDVGTALAALPNWPRVVVIDCLTLWVSNLVCAVDALQFTETDSRGSHPWQAEPPATEVRRKAVEAAQQRVEAETAALWDVCRDRSGTVVLVSGEVGQGVVPEYPLGRLYRDLLGRANQECAAQADEVYLLMAGLPIELKRLAVSASQVARRGSASAGEPEA